MKYDANGVHSSNNVDYSAMAHKFQRCDVIFRIISCISVAYKGCDNPADPSIISLFGKKIMKNPLVILTAIIASLLLGVVWMFGPGHDYFGVRNTIYAKGFSEDAYSGIHNGMRYEDVVTRLGEPVSANLNREYPVWAVRDDKVRDRLGKENTFDMKVISYSEPSDPMKDYELIQIAFGPDLTVINKEKWVTD